MQLGRWGNLEEALREQHRVHPSELQLKRLAIYYGCSQWVSAMKVREAIKAIEDDGWFLVRTRGSHRQYKHAQKPGLVTIAGKPSDELAPGTKNSILKQPGLK
jgi:predicted RNA binding protein YcfA (HicA-like mRNA interferase family)